jgi:DNA-binding NarL/FixJ family response regulator
LAINAFSAGLWRGRSPTSHLCVSAHSDVLAGDEPAAARSQRAIGQRQRDENREAVIAQAREKNAQAFAPWTKQEEEEVKRRFERGENVQHIARAHKRSPRAIELRLQRIGLLPPP